MSQLPKEIYVWDEQPEQVDNSLNINADGGRPEPEEGIPIRAGIYRLVRQVDIITDVKEIEVKSPVDPTTGFVRVLK